MLYLDRGVRSSAESTETMPHLPPTSGARARRWPDRLSGSAFRLFAALSVASAAVAALKAGPASGGGVLALGLLASGLVASLLRIAAGLIDGVTLGVFALLQAFSRGLRGIGRACLFNRRTRDAAETRNQVRKAVRPLRIRPVSSGHLAASTLDLHAARAVGTLDLLTRRPLRSGDSVFVCMGRSGDCGATFPRDIRGDLKAHFQDRCPSCGELGRFQDAQLPEPAAEQHEFKTPLEAAA